MTAEQIAWLRAQVRDLAIDPYDANSIFVESVAA